jgi:hypothetical protein
MVFEVESLEVLGLVVADKGDCMSVNVVKAFALWGTVGWVNDIFSMGYCLCTDGLGKWEERIDGCRSNMVWQ